MKLISKIVLYVLSTGIIFSSLFIGNAGVAAKEFERNQLPPAGPRLDIGPKEYLYLHASDQATILDRLIKCESGWKTEAKSKTSSATGLGQFINSTWLSTRSKMGRDTDLELRRNPYEMIDTILVLWDGGKGANHWLESRGCWAR